MEHRHRGFIELNIQTTNTVFIGLFIIMLNSIKASGFECVPISSLLRQKSQFRFGVLPCPR